MSKASILVVDDEEILLAAIVEMLCTDGFQVTGVTSAKDALAELDKKEFGLLMTDVMMPKMNGIELIARVQEKWPRLETVVISGHGTEATKSKLDMLGVFGYLDKPVKLADLVSVAREGLRSNRLERLGCGTAESRVALSRERVLVADDDQVICDILYQGLSKNGYNVLTTCDGEKALELLLINDYDLVVLDINMPKMNGIEAVKAIREFDPYTFVLVISGESVDDEVKMAMKNGADRFLAKPFSLANLLDILKKVNIEKIRKLKRNHIDKAKVDAGRRYGVFRRFMSRHFWIRMLKFTIFEFLAIIALSLVVGAITVYLCGGFGHREASDDATLDKAALIRKYGKDLKSGDLENLGDLRKEYQNSGK